MNLNRWIREGHRWLSIVFTAAVIANVVASLEKKETVWVGLMALVPLGLLLLTGLYLFVLPYLARWSRRRGSARSVAQA